jgi:hypothetical protein
MEPITDNPNGAPVAQSCTLPYRRIAFGRRGEQSTPQHFSRNADCKSAIQQIENLRYV